jgi:hypothetical protein
MAARIFGHLLDEEFIDLKKSLAVKVPLPVPGGTGNTLGVEDEREILLGARKQTCHAIPANALRRPGSRFQVLQGLAADIFIKGLP